MINITKTLPCDLPMVPFIAEKVQGFRVAIGKNVTNGAIGRFADFTFGRTPNVATIVSAHARAKMCIIVTCVHYRYVHGQEP